MEWPKPLRPASATTEESRVVSVSALTEAIESSLYDLISTDLFDTILLRDSTIESDRLAWACRRAAPKLGVDPILLTRLRWDVQDNAYRSVAIERPEGDVTLSAICRTVVAALGMGEQAARLLHDVEVDVDVEHLRPNSSLLDLLGRASRSGMRVIAVSDTYYTGVDLKRMLEEVVGAHPIAEVYSSADLGLTKHAGRIFDEVVRRENVSATKIIHVGDNARSDVTMAQAARWTAVHLPRDGRYRAAKFAGKAMALPTKMRRAR